MKKILISILIIIFSLTGFNLEVNAAALELYSTSLYSDANLVDYYRLEDASDSKGSYNLTNNNSVTFGAGLFNNGAVFASTKYLSQIITVSGDFTFTAWVKVGTEPGTNVLYRIIFGQTGDISGGKGRCLLLEYKDVSGTKKLGFANNIDFTPTDYTVTLGTTNWHHVAIVRSGNTFIGYYDGSSVAGPTTAATTDAGFVPAITNIGGQNVNNNFVGTIDDVAVFTRALTSTEISNLYTGAWPASAPPDQTNNFISFE